MRDRVKEQIARWVEPSASTFSGEVRLLAVHSVGPSAVDALIVLGIRARPNKGSLINPNELGIASWAS